jgi:hypothetical protein
MQLHEEEDGVWFGDGGGNEGNMWEVGVGLSRREREGEGERGERERERERERE